MAFSINTNIASLQAQFYLNQTNIFQSKTINRVTSGLRIVNSGDDAAGLAIANGLRDTQAVLGQGVRNVADAQAQLQTADTGIGNIGHMLDRLNSLAASSNSSLLVGGDTTRATLQKEFTSVVAEIDRQANEIGLGSTLGGLVKMNNIYVGGSGDSTTSTLAIDLSGAGVSTAALGISAVKTDAGSVALDSDATVKTKIGANTFATFTFDDGATHSFANGAAATVTVSLTGVTTREALLSAVNGSLAQMGQSNAKFAAQHVSASIDSTTGFLTFSTSNSGAIVVTGDAAGGVALFAATGTAAAGTGSVDISTQAAAQATIAVLTNAVNSMGTAQAAVGKGQNVLAYSLTLANSQLTNLAASESQIRDADLAMEAANLSKAQVLTQAGVAALAQANSAPQAVLSLLKG